jgi:hypothetical protein
LNPTQTFVFFADGRVAIPKEDLKDVSYPKLKFLTEKEIQEYDLKHIFKFLQDNINGFKDFLVNKKLEKIDVRINKNMNVKQVQEENKLNRLKNKTLEQ